MVEQGKSYPKICQIQTSKIFENNHNFVPHVDRNTERDFIPVEFLTEEAERKWDGSKMPKLGIEKRLDKYEKLLYIKDKNKLKVNEIAYWVCGDSSKVLISTEQRGSGQKVWLLLINEKGGESSYTVQRNPNSPRGRISYFPDSVLIDQVEHKTFTCMDGIVPTEPLADIWDDIEGHFKIFDKTEVLPKIDATYYDTPLDF
jgi:hypothetical protein